MDSLIQQSDSTRAPTGASKGDERRREAQPMDSLIQQSDSTGAPTGASKGDEWRREAQPMDSLIQQSDSTRAPTGASKGDERRVHPAPRQLPLAAAFHQREDVPRRILEPRHRRTVRVAADALRIGLDLGHVV